MTSTISATSTEHVCRVSDPAECPTCFEALAVRIADALDRSRDRASMHAPGWYREKANMLGRGWCSDRGSERLRRRVVELCALYAEPEAQGINADEPVPVDWATRLVVFSGLTVAVLVMLVMAAEVFHWRVR